MATAEAAGESQSLRLSGESLEAWRGDSESKDLTRRTHVSGRTSLRELCVVNTQRN